VDGRVREAIHRGLAENHVLHLRLASGAATWAGRMSKPFYITTAIYYVNGQPHLGHAYEMIISDVGGARAAKPGRTGLLLTGLDEHGIKVQQAAQKEGKTAQAYCDVLAKQWKEFAQRLGLTNDDFIRTTEPRHKAVVQAILAKLHAAGHFYKAPYAGFILSEKRPSSRKGASSQTAPLIQRTVKSSS
jgi:methionyl-tRNA synthetase